MERVVSIMWSLREQSILQHSTSPVLLSLPRGEICFVWISRIEHCQQLLSVHRHPSSVLPGSSLIPSRYWSTFARPLTNSTRAQQRTHGNPDDTGSFEASNLHHCSGACCPNPGWTRTSRASRDWSNFARPLSRHCLNCRNLIAVGHDVGE